MVLALLTTIIDFAYPKYNDLFEFHKNFLFSKHFDVENE